ncbi:MAG: hypothetical protein GXP55_02925 [Deltaproteobacteria bacterium]|nr:hypothetical protein [Deltaproteobacteria bacterium]
MMMPLAQPCTEIGKTTRLSFGGVEVELLADTALSLPDTHLACVPSGSTPTGTPRVVCSVNTDASLLGERRETRAITLSDDGDCLKTPGGRLRLSKTGARCWVASGRVAPSETALGALLEGLTAAVLELSGGLVMHAAGVELDGKAYLFVGPSGAGKTTAAGQVFGGRSFTVDRVALCISAHGAEAWALPGGTKPDEIAPPSAHARLPLGGVLRVVQASRVLALELASHQALLVLRESILTTNSSQGAEERRLDAIQHFLSPAPIVRLEFGLGAPLAHSLRSLESRATRPRETP